MPAERAASRTRSADWQKYGREQNENNGCEEQICQLPGKAVQYNKNNQDQGGSENRKRQHQQPHIDRLGLVGDKKGRELSLAEQAVERKSHREHVQGKKMNYGDKGDAWILAWRYCH